jgi:uncharacterized protein
MIAMQYPPSDLKNLLHGIENEHQLTVLYGLESGSRAWGFESQNSDYDIRFLYVRSVDWYLCIEKHSDVLDLGVSADLDISGWDLRKALWFLRQSHPVLLEWLRSPVVYLEKSEIIQQMREIGETFFAPRASVHHYVGWAERILRRYFNRPELSAKRYFYVIRPILCCRWIETVGGQPPLLIQELLTEIKLPTEAKLALDNLIIKKRAGDELDLIGRIPALDRYIAETLPQIKSFSTTLPKPKYAPYERLNPLFHQALKEFSKN